MTRFDQKIFSIIFVGRQNPQILNHEFLLKNNIFPTDKLPFKDIPLDSKEKKPFDNFVSIPVMANLRYKNVNITIEENRYQISDKLKGAPNESSIIEFTKRYFNLLRYTPITVGGFNFKGSILFDSDADRSALENKLIIDKKKICESLGLKGFESSFKLEYPCENGRAMLSIQNVRINKMIKNVNFNYEFNYKDIDSFLKNLDLVSLLYGKFKSILKKIGVICS